MGFQQVKGSKKIANEKKVIFFFIYIILFCFDIETDSMIHLNLVYIFFYLITFLLYLNSVLGTFKLVLMITQWGIIDINDNCAVNFIYVAYIWEGYLYFSTPLTNSFPRRIPGITLLMIYKIQLYWGEWHDG